MAAIATDVFQSNSAARLKLDFAFAQSDRLPQLRRCHIIEQNDIDPFDLDEGTHLLEVIGFQLPPARRDVADGSGERVPRNRKTRRS